MKPTADTSNVVDLAGCRVGPAGRGSYGSALRCQGKRDLAELQDEMGLIRAGQTPTEFFAEGLRVIAMCGESRLWIQAAEAAEAVRRTALALAKIDAD